MAVRSKNRAAIRALGIMAAGVIAISFIFHPADLPGVEICQFKRLTGLPCPGCGLTRGFCAISHGDFGRAWGLNPFSFPFYGAALLVILAPFIARVRPRTVDRFLASPVLLYGCVSGALVMTAWGIWRMIAAGT